MTQYGKKETTKAEPLNIKRSLEEGCRDSQRWQSMLWQKEGHHQRWGLGADFIAEYYQKLVVPRSFALEPRKHRKREHPKFSLQS